MLRLLVLSLVLIALVHADSQTCRVRRGKKMITFGRSKERVKIPCKYPAIRNTRCGNWRVTVTPGNEVEADRNKRFIIEKMWVGVERVSDGMKWEGRSTLSIARKFLNDQKDAPFNKVDGSLEITDVFDFGSRDEDDEVSLIAKDGSFKITFGLYEPGGAWHKASGFEFQCNSEVFEPSPYPHQLCGNGTKDESKLFKKANGFSDRRQAVTFFNVFSNMGVAQTDSDCATTMRTLSNKCEGREVEASELCWRITGRKRFHRCITKNLRLSKSAMRHCVEWVCSGKTDPNSCLELSEALDGCTELVGVSEDVKNSCAPDMSIKY